MKPGRTVRVMRAETFPKRDASFVAELAAESGDEDFAVVIADVDDIDTDTIGIDHLGAGDAHRPGMDRGDQKFRACFGTDQAAAAAVYPYRHRAGAATQD